MKHFIKYFYKDCLVSIMSISEEQKLAGWANNNPPFQPENWDKWLVESKCADCG